MTNLERSQTSPEKEWFSSLDSREDCWSWRAEASHRSPFGVHAGDQQFTVWACSESLGTDVGRRPSEHVSGEGIAKKPVALCVPLWPWELTSRLWRLLKGAATWYMTLQATDDSVQVTWFPYWKGCEKNYHQDKVRRLQREWNLDPGLKQPLPDILTVPHLAQKEKKEVGVGSGVDYGWHQYP